jgi:catechol 2,3-dioxygenase-like lactoylglutathione lyase family enzyme
VCLKLCVASTGDRTDDAVFTGISVAVPSLAAAVEAALVAGCDVLRPPANTTHSSSLVPDEDPYLVQPWFLRAVVKDPSSGLDVEFIQHPQSASASPEHPTAHGGFKLRHVTVSVSDVQAAMDYASTALGMTLHRYRSLVPTEPAMSAYLNYANGEHDATLLELRYSYGRIARRPKAQSPATPAVLGIMVPGVAGALAELNVGTGGVLGPADGVALGPPMEGLRLALIDELSFLTEAL